MDKPLDPVVQLDKHAEVGKALDLPYIRFLLLDIGEVAGGTQPENSDIILLHSSLSTHREPEISVLIAYPLHNPPMDNMATV
jgi:hypothetical protein